MIGLSLLKLFERIGDKKMSIGAEFVSTQSLPAVCTGGRAVSVTYADVIAKLSRIDRFPISIVMEPLMREILYKIIEPAIK